MATRSCGVGNGGEVIGDRWAGPVTGRPSWRRRCSARTGWSGCSAGAGWARSTGRSTPSAGRAVALKRLPSTLAGDPEFQARFRNESALAARLREPHIIPIHDFGEIDGRLFIDMRLVEGIDLAALLGRGRSAASRRGRCTSSRRSPRALDFAHADGLVHRDVKPGNVLRPPGRTGDDDFVYLVDFGHRARGEHGLER